MKNLTIFGLFIIGIIISCENENHCNYNITEYASDTSLFISYEKDGKQYKFFQVSYESGRIFDPLEYSETMELYYYSRSISFDRLLSDSEYYNYLHPAISLTFWNYKIQEKLNQEELYKLSFLKTLSSDLENSSYNYVCPPLEPVLSDSVFMKGLCFDSYTKTVHEYFDYNVNEIQNFYSENSYFNINDIQSVCNDYFLIQGTFSTKYINDNDTVEIKNGLFTFITK